MAMPGKFRANQAQGLIHSLGSSAAAYMGLIIQRAERSGENPEIEVVEAEKAEGKNLAGISTRTRTSLSNRF